MDYAWGWWFFWSILFFMILFGAFSRWSSRSYRDRYYYDRDYRANYPDYLWPYAYTPMPSFGRNKGRGPRNYRRSDERIAEDINDRLFVHGEIDATEVLVQVKGGEVTLSGSVESRTDKRIAEALADSVPGVTDVKNQLVITKLKRGEQPKAA